ncbi:hypothetical protein PoB_000429300 [Plakobranchus ocellatus]|uniref:Uncharacterized protein n=1 Tax=Plakobranchus ocellatus TaxID=259542 RepID=A0AAV3Y5T2_9GAST|nr:hypothetical protein PoB_000429300 [Plakobranchus ocellatus]
MKPQHSRFGDKLKFYLIPPHPALGLWMSQALSPRQSHLPLIPSGRMKRRHLIKLSLSLLTGKLPRHAPLLLNFAV